MQASLRPRSCRNRQGQENANRHERHHGGLCFVLQPAWHSGGWASLRPWAWPLWSVLVLPFLQLANLPERHSCEKNGCYGCGINKGTRASKRGGTGSTPGRALEERGDLLSRAFTKSQVFVPPKSAGGRFLSVTDHELGGYSFHENCGNGALRLFV